MADLGCRAARRVLPLAAGDPAAEPGLAAHLAGCPACAALAASARADLALLSAALPARAPAGLAPPVPGDRLAPVAIALPGRAAPFAWLAVPAAAAAAALLVATLARPAPAPAPVAAVVHVEPLDEADWDVAMLAVDRDAPTGPAGAAGERLLAAFAGRAGGPPAGGR